MSSKNKRSNKILRGHERGALDGCERTPVSQIAQKTSLRLLSNPKQKMTGSTRRRLQASRGFALVRPLGLDKLQAAVKVALKLEALPLVKLIRRLKQSARRASTCKHLIDALHPGSKFLAGLTAEQTHQLSLCRQISAEISVRNHQTQH